jgi:hypothetical protein
MTWIIQFMVKFWIDAVLQFSNSQEENVLMQFAISNSFINQKIKGFPSYANDCIWAPLARIYFTRLLIKEIIFQDIDVINFRLSKPENQTKCNIPKVLVKDVVQLRRVPYFLWVL